MSSNCQNFSQNAWKKDLCSHCFKSKEEHNRYALSGIKSKQLITTTSAKKNSNEIININLKPQSIIKLNNNIGKSKRSVCFLKNESEIIGFGGEDWSDSEEFEISETLGDEDVPPDTEEEKELQRLTKSNTDFNTINSNLLGDNNTETRRTFTQLMLGKPLTDSDGRKQTLMVSVTPFGQEQSMDENRKSIIKPCDKKALSHSPIAKNKESIAESKTTVVLTAFSKSSEQIGLNTGSFSTEEKSLLDEITETLEKNNVQMNEKQLCTNKTGIRENDASKNNEIKIDEEYIKTKAEPVFITGNKDTENKELDKKLTSDMRKNGLTRQSAIKVNQEKTMVYQKPKNNEIVKSSTNADKNILNANLEVCNAKEKELKIDNERIIVETTSPVLVKTDNNFNGINDFKFVKNDLSVLEKTEIVTNFNDNRVNDLNLSEKTTHLRKVEGECKEIYAKNNFSQSELMKTSITSLLIEKNVFNIKESRELAGEPDGRADPEISSEPPALPRSPPPIGDPRSSFLHSNIKRPPVAHKPKIPAKPKKVLQVHPVVKKTDVILKTEESLIEHSGCCSQNNNLLTDLDSSLNREAFEDIDINNISMENNISFQESNYENIKDAQMKISISKQDSNSSDINKTSNKRKAPKPPTPTPDESLNTLYSRNVSTSYRSDSPVVREKEKRERASSCSPKFRNGFINVNPSGESTPDLSFTPEPAPRRSLSLSQDSLSLTIYSEKNDDKKKVKNKFSLKKFLRMGNNKDLDKSCNGSSQKNKLDDTKHIMPLPKPRLVIVHPLELNGNEVEVLKPDVVNCNSLTSSLKDDCNISTSNSSISSNERNTPSPTRTNKPPPPPRNFNDRKESKPCRPLPPKNVDILHKLSARNGITFSVQNPNDNIYANVGEVRAALAPSKPVRTASMRERDAALETQKRRQISKYTSQTEHNYESVDVRNKENVENVYDYLHNQRSSSPECDFNLGKSNLAVKNDIIKNRNATQQRRSDGVINNFGDYCKLQSNFIRATSLPYCGSETESEIYSPYSFYGSELDMCEEESDWSNTAHSNRTCRLRSRKGRSIVHKNLEDNYGAVVIANHEALAQVLDHINLTSTIQAPLRGLKNAPNLRWTDFSIMEGASSINVGKRSFYTALWGIHHVTLELTREQGSMLQSNSLSLAPYCLCPITEFSDLVPIQYLPKYFSSVEKDNLIQATIAVLPCLQVDTLQSMGTLLHAKAATITQPLNEETLPMTEDLVCKEACFLLLQLINSLKCLQAQGIEELPLSLTNFVLCRDLERDLHPRLCVLQSLAEDISRCNNSADDRLGSLCECSLEALNILLPKYKITPLLKDLLSKERAVSLTQVKSVLEFTLWGPSDVALSTPVKDRELALQRWLDLERATVLHGLVKTRVQLTVLEECHLLFLVRSSAKMMCEASLLLELT